MGHLVRHPVRHPGGTHSQTPWWLTLVEHLVGHPGRTPGETPGQTPWWNTWWGDPGGLQHPMGLRTLRVRHSLGDRYDKRLGIACIAQRSPNGSPLPPKLTVDPQKWVEITGLVGGFVGETRLVWEII